MSFINDNLSVLSYANGFTLWRYITKDNIETVMQEKYFKSIKYLANEGDIIIVNASDDTRFVVVYFENKIIKTKFIK